MINIINNKKNKKIFSFLITILVVFNQFSLLPASYIHAKDSPEEIAREQEEARREAERRTQRQAEEAAREAVEAAREAIEDVTPTPIPPTPQPQLNPTITPNTLEGESGVSASNEETGVSSSNDNQGYSNTNVSTNNNNSANVSNNVSTNANTGNNVISGDQPPNSTPTPTPTKKIEPLPSCEDNLAYSNNNGGEEDSFSTESTEVAANQEFPSSQTSGGSADTSTEDNDTVTVVNSNCAAISAGQNISAISGNNQASGNEGSTMETGDTFANSQLTNEGNKNITRGSEATDSNNEVTSGQTSTGTSFDNHDQVKVENNNQIYVDNEVKVESVSGANTLNNNDGQAELSTGDVDIIVTLLNILNLNITGEDFTHLIINIFGDLNGEVDLDKIARSLGMNEEEIQAIARNEETEAERNNNVRNSQSLGMDVDNNNEAVVRNNIEVTGVSGNNNLSNNEDRTRLLTGRIKILVALINFINTNYTGTDWYFAMINIFGSLSGDIILPDPNGFLIDETKAVNSKTSDGSNNNITTTSENNLEVNNQNQVNLTNNIQATGDSGNNVAYNNEDRVSQESGNVSVITNLTNWLNINILGNNWVLLIINVFGKWYGRIIGFPGKGDIDAPASGMLMVAAGGATGNGPTVSENSQTGENSSNDVLSENSENLNVNNNNQATLENNVNVKGISGGNTTNQNEDPVSVVTGWIDISVDLLNIVNLNITGKHWLLVLVNVFGDFFGDITFPGAKKTEIAEFTAVGGLTSQFEEEESENQGTEEVNNNQEIITLKISLTPTPSPSTVRVLTFASTNEQNLNSSTEQIEIYKAESSNLEQSNTFVNTENNTFQILGISFEVSRTIQQTLFLIALFAYLIAFRFWAFKKSS